MKKSPLFINCQLRNVSTDPLKHQNNDSTPLTPANMLQLGPTAFKGYIGVGQLKNDGRRLSNTWDGADEALPNYLF